MSGAVKSTFLSPHHVREKLPLSRVKSADPGDGLVGRADGEVAGRSCPASPLVKRSLRLVVVGSAGVGKTSILRRFLGLEVSHFHAPTIEDFHRKMYKIRGELYQLDIIDTGGNAAFPAARRLQLLTGDLFLVVAALDSQGSWAEALRLREEIEELKQTKAKGPDAPPLPLVIALNKTDLPADRHEVSVKDCDEKVKEVGVLFPCSALTGQAINGIFAGLFMLGRLPKQMLPQQHVQLGPRRSAEPPAPPQEEREGESGHSALSRLKSRRQKDKGPPVSYTQSDARRPSLRSDLLSIRANSSMPHGFPPDASPTSPSKKCLIM